MTPEEQFKAVVRAAFTEYRNQVDDGFDASNRRLAEVRDHEGRLVGHAFEVNWLPINDAVEGV